MWGQVSRALTPGKLLALLTRSMIGTRLYPQTAGEAAAAYTPTDIAFDPTKGYDARRAGVVGDGVVDDTAALRKIVEVAGPYAAVFIPPTFTCLVTGAIIDASLAAAAVGQTWFGGGKIITANGFNHHVFELSGVPDFTLLGIHGASGTLGAAYSAATARFFRAVSGSHRARMLFCRVEGFQSAAQFNNSTDGLVFGSTLLNPYGWGVNIQTDADYCGVAETRVIGAANEHGVYISGSSGNRVLGAFVRGVRVSGCAVDGIKTTYAENPKVAGCYSWGNVGQGIYVTVGTDRAHVVENHVESNGENGILVYDGTANSDRNLVALNTVRKNDKNGISVSSAGAGTVTRTRVIDNDVDDNDQEATGAQYGIVQNGAGVSGTEIRDNRVSNEVIGVRISSGGGARIENNDLSDGNATPLSTALSTDRIIGNRGYMEGADTYDPPSLADGEGVTTTVTCTGAVLGDQAEASFSLDLQGVVMKAYVQSGNTVAVRFQNESGGVVDLASGTLRVRAWRL